MRKVSYNYPYPVLNDSNDDFSESCSFNIDLGSAYVYGEEFVLPFSYSLVCPSIEDMIRNGEAEAVIQLESPETSFRDVVRFGPSEKIMEYRTSRSNLGSETSAKGFVVSLKDIYLYQPPERNVEMFENVPFRIHRNDILAISNDKLSIPVESYDPLADRPSIFSIRKTDREEEIEIDYRQPKITIWINKELYNTYSEYYKAPENRVLLSSFFAVPALEDVISMLKMYSRQDRDQEFGKYKWYQVIKSRLSAENLDIDKEDSIIKIANRLLPHVFKSNVEEFGNMYKQYNSGED